MSIFSKIKQFFSGSQSAQLSDNAAIVAPYKVEVPVITEVVKPMVASATPTKKKPAARLPKAKPAATPAKKSRKTKPRSE
jgi:hypothetical protein